MQIVKDIYLDFYQGEMVVVTAKQGDVGRFLRVTLLDNGNAFQIPAGATATIARGEVWNTCTIDTDGTVLAPITADMEPGRRPAQIEISQGSDRLSSWNFILDVMFSARDDQAIEGSNEYSQLQQLVDQAEGLIEDVGNTAINFTPASMKQNLSVGDTIKQAFGKIYKWFADLGAAAFQAVANNCTTTASGSVLDARQGKTLYDRIGELNQLATSAKGSVVDAINELNSKIVFGTAPPSNLLKNVLDKSENKVIFLRMWTCPNDGPNPGYNALWNFVVINQPQSGGEVDSIYNYCKVLAFAQNTNGTSKLFYIGYFQSSGDLTWSENLVPTQAG